MIENNPITAQVPKVLLLGNGVVMSKTRMNWNALLNLISERPDEKAEDLFMSMPLRAIYLTNDSLRSKLKANKAAFFGQIQDEIIRERLHSLFSLNFDEILTTNYSYELEIAAIGSSTVSENYLKKVSKNIVPGEHAEAKYLLSTCNHVSDGKSEHRIWHIHGEARKPDSMILGHYYYALR